MTNYPTFEHPILWILVSNGEVTYESWYEDPEAVLSEARMNVTSYIGNFLRHELPFRVDEEVINQIDVAVYGLPKESEPFRLELPYQQWFDEYYREQQEYKKNEDKRDLERYLELKARLENKGLISRTLTHQEWHQEETLRRDPNMGDFGR